MSARIITAIGAGALVFVLAIMAGRALAHDDYSWIRNPEYVDGNGVHCCSERDCLPIDAKDVVMGPNNYHILPTRELVPYGKEYGSQDQKFYACRAHDQTLRCFFAPIPGN